MNKSLTLAVLIRTYNAIKSIDKCVETVYLQQEMYPDKIFICDDYSTDGTWEHLVSLYGNDSRIVLMRNDSNHGPGYTMKRLIMTCDTDYYMLIDDDDYWIRTDVIERVKNDIVVNGLPDKIYYKANDVCDWRLHFVFTYKTLRMQCLIYFSLWSNDDDYTLQTLEPSFKETIDDNYIFMCPYIGKGISRIIPSISYRYIHAMCKFIYMGNVAAAAHMYIRFPYINECTEQDFIILDEITEYFRKINITED